MDNQLKNIVFTVSLNVYSLEAVFITCHAFLDRFYIFLDQKKKDLISISLSLKEGGNFSLSACRGEFLNELLNNSLRCVISKRNQNAREMIIKEALFFSQPKEDIEDSISVSDKKVKSKKWQNDPLGIAQDWEKKHNLSGKK